MLDGQLTRTISPELMKPFCAGFFVKHRPKAFLFDIVTFWTMIVYGVIISMSIDIVLFITGALTYIYVLCMAVSNLNLQSV